MDGEAFAFFHWARLNHSWLPAGRDDRSGWRCETFRHRWESLRLYGSGGSRRAVPASAPVLDFRRDVATHMFVVAVRDEGVTLH